MKGEYERSVQEQLAEALPVLSQSALAQASDGLDALLDSVATPSHQKLIIWLWTFGFERFGPVSKSGAGRGFRISLPDEGGDIEVAMEDVALSVRVDPVRSRTGSLEFTSSQLDKRSHNVAKEIVDQLASRIEKNTRKQRLA